MNTDTFLKAQVSYSRFKLTGLIGGPVVFLLMMLLPVPEGMTPGAWNVAALGALMVIWWVTEAIPLPATSLLPLIVLPGLGLLDIKQATAPYASPAIFLFLGGFMIAVAMERWHLHKRIALNIIRLVGTGSASVIAGFMIATALLSMWVSNTATVVMMMPIALAVIHQLIAQAGDVHPKDQRNFAIAMLLGIAYAASIGGVATLVGTPPNIMLKGFLSNNYGIQLQFLDWMRIGVPFSAIMLVLTWLVLKWVFPNDLGAIPGSKDFIQDELKKLGTMSRGEITVALVFVCTAVLWVTQGYINDWLNAIRPVTRPDGSAYYVTYLKDANIAILGALLLFIIPVKLRDSQFALNWKDSERLPWGILLLFGGGLSLASGMQITGLTTWIGGQFTALGDLPTWLVVILIVAGIMFLTEIMSNVATITAFLPVIAAIAHGLGLNPLMLAIPATIAASCAFMMPVATPPNAIVFGSGYIRVPDMARAGFILNLLAVGVITLLIHTVEASLVEDLTATIPGK